MVVSSAPAKQGGMGEESQWGKNLLAAGAVLGTAPTTLTTSFLLILTTQPGRFPIPTLQVRRWTLRDSRWAAEGGLTPRWPGDTACARLCVSPSGSFCLTTASCQVNVPASYSESYYFSPLLVMVTMPLR